MCNTNQLAKGRSRLIWDTINWDKIEKRISRVQRRIFKASLVRKIGLVHNLQVRLINSLDAKLLSVRQITKCNTENRILLLQNSKTITSERKVSLAYNIKIHQQTSFFNSYRKRDFFVNEKLSSSYFYLKDKIKQNLIRLALEPEFKAKFEDECSVARPAQSSQEALHDIYITFRKAPGHIIFLDFSSSFNNFKGLELLKQLESLQIIKKHIKNWLKADIIPNYLNSLSSFDSLLVAQNKRSSNNFEVAPLLINIVLHNLLNSLKSYVKKLSILKRVKNDSEDIRIISYLTQVLIICPNKLLAEKVFHETTHLLSINELDVSLSTLKIISSNSGFNFWGFQVITLFKNGKSRTKIHISKQSVFDLLLQLRYILQKNKAVSAYTLIKKLNRFLIPWAEYFRYFQAAKDFAKVDYKIYSQIRAWVFRRKAQGKNRSYLKEKYFPENKEYVHEGNIHKDNWVLVGQRKLKSGKLLENYLIKLRWIKVRKIPKTRYNYSFCNENYRY
jgi:RNA-directed DNA polymerase